MRRDPVSRSRTIVAAQLAAEETGRPAVSSLGRASFVLTAWWGGLTPGEWFHVTWTGYFEDGDTYTLGMNPGKPVGRDGVLSVATDVADLVYFNPGEPLEWARVALRPPGSPTTVEATGPDGLPLAVNVDTGDFRVGGYGA